MNDFARSMTRMFRPGGGLVLALTVLLGMTMCGPNAPAQSGAGSIQGTVTDSTGAVVPGAAIQVVNQGTGVVVNSKSNSAGFYQAPGLFTGSYVVTSSAPGMKTYKTTIQLLVDQNAVINPVLTPGRVTQEVVVSGNEVQLTDMQDGTVGATLENARINQLPMNGRDLLTLTGETTPGLGSCAQAPLGTCANGLAGSAMEYVDDGVTLTNREFGGESQGQNQMPDPDSVQEVQVETSGLGAQYATPAAAILTTKSGTNSVHGTLFETARNNAFGIAKLRQNPSNYAAPPYIRNEFGASAGGPIVLPHVYHGKDKSFWFFAYERYSLSQVSNENAYVPTMAMRAGDFSQLKNSAGVLQTLYDPATTQSGAGNWSRQTFTQEYNEGASNPAYCNGDTNCIPINRLSPAAKILFDITPPPTSTNNPLVLPNLEAVDPAETRVPNITFRLDHVFNENNRAYLRFTDIQDSATSLHNVPSDQPASIAADGLPADASGMNIVSNTTFATAIGFTHVFSPSFFSETVVSQQWWSNYASGGGSPSTDFEKELGLPNNFGTSGFPQFIGNITPFDGTMFQYGLSQIIQDVDENLTKTIGRHQLRFGGRYRHERFGLPLPPTADTVTFDANATGLLNPATIANDTYTAEPNTGNANGDMFLGAASQYSLNLQPPYDHFHDMEFDAYFQDDYHVRRNLVLNLGLRYEAHPAPWEKYGAMMSFDLKNDALVTAAPLSKLIAEGLTTQAIITNDENDGAKFETPQEAGMPSALIKNNDLTVGPRLGFAYQLFGGRHGTVIRGGYGRYIFPIPVRYSLLQVNQDNPFVANYVQNYNSAAQSPDGLPSYELRSPQTVVMGTNSSGAVNSSTTGSILPGIKTDTLAPDFKPSFATQVNFTIEQALKGNSVLRVSWMWSHGSYLDTEYDYNYHPSTYVWEMQTGIAPPNGGASTIGTDQYATTGTGPYDKTTWASNSDQDQSSGWSNDNALQVNYQRLFHHGIAYQISYVWSKPMRVGGAHSLANSYFPAADYVGTGNTVGTMTSPYGTVIAPTLPPPLPTGAPSWASYHTLLGFENKEIDTETPIQNVRFNGIVDLPFGRGKRFMSNSNRLVNQLIGGFQLAGDGVIVSQNFPITATHWGPTNSLHVYKHKMPITDCRSGVCYKSFEWFNGYVAPTANANVDCTTDCITGLTSTYAPYQTPIDNTPNTTYYGQDEVSITLANGKTSPIVYAPGPTTSTSQGGGAVGENPYSKTILNGPMNWTADASLFKVFPITEKVNLRFNMDAFNVFNVQGYNNPNPTDGTEAVTPGAGVASSYNTARQLQFTLRLTF